MPVIDDMTVRAIALRASARQRHEMGAADEQVEPVIVEPDPQPVSDQPRRHGVEHFPQREAAGRRDGDDDFLIIAGAPVGQRLQRGALGIDAGTAASVLGRHDLVDEAAIGGQIIEVARGAQQERVANRRLEMAVRALDPAILMRDAAVVAGRRHAVMPAQRVVAGGEIRPGFGIKIAEGRRQAVAAVLRRRTAQRPQRVLQPFGKRDVTLAAQDHMGMFEARPHQPEVIEAMIERLPGNQDAKIAHVGEVGQAEPARLMDLTEDHLLFGSVKRPPGADAPFHGAPDPGIEIGMTPAHLFEDRHRPQPRRCLQEGHDLVLENLGQWIGPAPLARLGALRGKHRRLGNPITRCRAEPRLRGCRRDAVGLSKLHEEPHLMIVDVATRHPRHLPQPWKCS